MDKNWEKPEKSPGLQSLAGHCNKVIEYSFIVFKYNFLILVLFLDYLLGYSNNIIRKRPKRSN